MLKEVGTKNDKKTVVKNLWHFGDGGDMVTLYTKIIKHEYNCNNVTSITKFILVWGPQ